MTNLRRVTKFQLQNQRPARRQRSPRSGAAILETMVVLLAMLTLLFGFVDLGLAVVRHNILSEASRRLAREAIVHGEQAAKEGTAWGPTMLQVAADSATDQAAHIRPILATLRPSDVFIQVTWPDGDNKVGSRVRVRLTAQHRWLTPLIWGGDGLPLSATSTMRVVF